MIPQKLISTKQREQKSIARKDSYISYIQKYPLYSTLMVLDDYEKEEVYEECAIIRDAISEYKSKYKETLPKGIKIPNSIGEYKGRGYQDMLLKYNIVVEDKLAQEKAKLIKLNLPIKNGL